MVLKHKSTIKCFEKKKANLLLYKAHDMIVHVIYTEACKQFHERNKCLECHSVKFEPKLPAIFFLLQLGKRDALLKYYALKRSVKVVWV